MITTTAELRTVHASKYLMQLCKHFAHRIDVVYTDTHGECRFVCGTAILDADDDQLRIATMADDDGQLAQTQDVIESHLIRFAFREGLSSLDWTTVGAA